MFNVLAKNLLRRSTGTKLLVLNCARNFATPAKSGPAAKIVPPASSEDESFVDMDAEKLLKYCCVNYLKDSQPIEIKPDDQYPEWLWELKLGEPPTLDELDPNYYEYWQKLDEIYKEQMKMRRATRYQSGIVQRKNWKAGDKEFFAQEEDDIKSKELH